MSYGLNHLITIYKQLWISYFEKTYAQDSYLHIELNLNFYNDTISNKIKYYSILRIL